MKIILLCFFISALNVDAQDAQNSTKVVKCSYFRNYEWEHVGKQWTCFLDKDEIIDTPDKKFLQPQDPKVTVVALGYNQNVKYLPANTGDAFPNLMAMFARNASIEAIYKKNFEGLENLQYIHLGSNKIKKIANDTFRDLVSLHWLMMDDNQIQFMHGQALKGLQNLKHVNLFLNQCVDEDFEDDEIPIRMPEMITRQCGQCPNNRDISNCELLSGIKQEQTKTRNYFETFYNSLTVEQKTQNVNFGVFFENTLVQFQNSTGEAAKLMVQINATREAAASYEYQYKAHNAYTKKIYDEKVDLESRNNDLKAKIVEIDTKYKLKLQEADAKKKLISQTSEEVKGLEMKIKALNDKAADLGRRYCD